MREKSGWGVTCKDSPYKVVGICVINDLIERLFDRSEGGFGFGVAKGFTGGAGR